MFFHPKNLKSENNNPWFKPWFNILLHTQSIVCATVNSHCLEYLGYITLPQRSSSLSFDDRENSKGFLGIFFLTQMHDWLDKLVRHVFTWWSCHISAQKLRSYDFNNFHFWVRVLAHAVLIIALRILFCCHFLSLCIFGHFFLTQMHDWVDKLVRHVFARWSCHISA